MIRFNASGRSTGTRGTLKTIRTRETRRGCEGNPKPSRTSPDERHDPRGPPRLLFSGVDAEFGWVGGGEAFSGSF